LEITIPQPLIQQYHRYIARSCVSNYLNAYFKLEAVSTIMTGEAKRELRKQLGDKWPFYYRRFKKARQLAYDMKYYYDALRSKEIYRKDQNHPLAKKARMAYHKIPIIMPEVDELHLKLLQIIPSIGMARIPNDCFQKEQKKSTTFDDYDSEKKSDEDEE